jgi:hypothetical protein
MMTEAFADPLVGGCDGDAVIEADAEGLALGVTTALADGFAVSVGFGVALGFAVAVAVVFVAVDVGLDMADAAGVGAAVVGSTKAVGGAGCGIVELGAAIVDETGASAAGMLAAVVTCSVAFECASREIATVPTTRTATLAAAARAMMSPRPRDGDSPDCGKSRAFLRTRHRAVDSTRR